ncbi:MAG: hypothetical protein JNM99_08450 [Verrucomicrobiaceae bacterium]|nr:hypothetical protein [Verrucomicrobiaceae bacterium]
MNRRTLLRSALALPAVVAAGTQAARQQTFIDCNVWIGEHPNRHLPWRDAARLAVQLQRHGVTQAWASTFDAILHRDLRSANDELARQCTATSGLVRPVGAINPTLPDWQQDLVHCAETHHMHAIRLLPGYHGYTLEDPRFQELLNLAHQHRLLVQIAVQLEDQRTQHPLLQVPDVDLKPLAKDAWIMVLNANASHVLTGLRGKKAVIDTAFIEGVGGLENLLKSWPQEQLVFGSHSPWFYWEANGLKLLESELSEDQATAIRSGNALAICDSAR